jgi:hypothetical protein
MFLTSSHVSSPVLRTSVPATFLLPSLHSSSLSRGGFKSHCIRELTLSSRGLTRRRRSSIPHLPATRTLYPTSGPSPILCGFHHCHCDRTTSEMRGLSPKIISGDSRRSENTQTHTHKHTVPNMKFKLKLLQIKCHVLGFIKDKAQNVFQRIIRVFAEAFVSHDRHTLFALE